MEKEDLKIDARYNWKYQEDRLIYMGTKHHHGDCRTWYQFALVNKPLTVWCEVLETDLENIEETKMESDQE